MAISLPSYTFSGSRWAILRRAVSATFLSLVLAPAVWAIGTCDLNSDGQVNVADVQLGINQSLGSSECTSADINSDGQCNVVDVQLLVNTALGEGCPVPLTENPPASRPWVYGFTPKRIHYVDDVSCGGSGTIGSPECSSTAFHSKHYQCGDLHIFRAGTHLNSASTTLETDCSSSSPAVWKGYVGPDGQQERAVLNTEVNAAGNWHWFVNLDMTNTHSSGDKTLEMKASGVRVINSVAHDAAHGSVMAAWDDGPGQVIYGTVFYRPATQNQSGYAFYTQNDFKKSGWKYWVQNIVIDMGGVDDPNHFNAYTASSDGAITGYYLQDNFFGGGPSGDNSIMRWSDGSSDFVFNIVLKNNFFVHFSRNGDSLQLGPINRAPNQFEVTGNYFARANIAPESYWGNTGTKSPTIFTGNEIYDPPGGHHVRTFRTSKAGAHRIVNADVWNNNTYGGKFRADTMECGGSDFEASTLSQWRTRTAGCRVSSGAGGFDLGSKEVSNPTTPKIRVVKNEYQCPNCVFKDQARGNIYVVNWGNRTSNLTVDISSVVSPNKQYTVRYARDFYGTAAASGTCPGSGACNVSLPTKRTPSGSAGQFGLVYIVAGKP